MMCPADLNFIMWDKQDSSSSKTLPHHPGAKATDLKLLLLRGCPKISLVSMPH